VGSIILLMITGLPVAFCFMLVGLVGAVFFWGGDAGLRQFISGLLSSVASFRFLAIPLFIIMGEVMFQSGVVPLMIGALDKWIGRLPGRLGLLAVGGGTIFSTLTGTSLASVAVLGSTLVPEMEERGYKKPMSLGPILGSGGLAVMIPPSGLAVFIAAVAEASIGRMLIAIIVPGLIMAALYAMYIIGRCHLQPYLAPPYEITPTSLSEKVVDAALHILPIGLIIFMVVGVIFVGIATPSEAAATGAIGAFILAAAYRSLNWEKIKKTFAGTLEVTIMLFMIVAGATAFSQILASSGASRSLAEFAAGLPLPPIVIVIIMQVVLLFLGMFMSVAGIIMITLPIFVPIICVLGFDPVWFGVTFLLNMEMAMTSPPVGMGLFVMKGVAPSDTTMGDIYRAALPFLYCDLVVMILLLAFPAIALWLPGLML